MATFLHKPKIISTLVCVLVFLGLQPSFAQHEGEPTKKTIKVAYFDSNGFQEKSPTDGHRFGYGYEYLQKIAYFASWKYDYIDTTWTEALKMIKNGEVDIITKVTKTLEREQNILFADRAMGTEEYYLYIRPNSSKIKINDLTTLNGKLIGINAGTHQLNIFREWIKENNLNCKIIEYEDDDKRNQDFLNGTIDAAIDYDFYLDLGWIPLTNIGKSNYYIAVNQNRKDILEELNVAQAKLFESSPLFIEHLQNYYFPHEIISEHLSDREKAWISDHLKNYGNVKLGYIDGYLPYCAKNEKTGELEGSLSVFVKKLKELFNVELETIAYKNLQELYKAVQNNEICACFPIYNMLWQTEELGIMQTEPLVDYPQALVYRKGEYANMEKIKNFAVPKTSHMMPYYIRDKYPESNITFYENYDASLKAVSKGKDKDKPDGMFINTFILARFYNDYLNYKNLNITYMENDASLGIGVSFSGAELLSVFNKTIALLDKSVITSSLVHNSQMEKPYFLRRFFQDHLLTIVLIILCISTLAIFFLRHQIKTIRNAKRKADKLNKELEAALEREKESQIAVHEAFEAANKANAAKTEFLASMSHDIRTPMNAIVGMTAIAAANLGDSEKIQHCLSEITISSKHLLGLINEVLDMNKIESGKVSLNTTEFNLADLIDDFILVSKPLIKGKRHNFIVNIHDIKHENVIGDAERLHQCMMNFMSNAVKYTPEGGTIKLSITEKPTNKPKIGCYEFCFEDNGIGMSKEFIPTIFEPFARASDERAQKQQGTGLGLSITNNIVRMMNGDIKVESELNVGTKITTTVFLELYDNTDEMDITSLVDLPVLVADDDKVACESTCFVLNELGMKGEWVLSGKDAVEKVVEHHNNQNDFFAVIVDWRMPDMDGVETTKSIREKVGNDVPIIIISAYDWSDIEEDARKAGANAFIAKPIFKSKIAHTFLELTGKENTKDEQVVLDKYKQENFSGTRVLLVEDIEVNAEITKEILGMTGLSVDIAWNGKEAVEKLSESSDGYYSMVFMDIQMPIMNGYEATQNIRKSDREYLKKIPIVAMSANAFAEDVQKSISSGMNDHVAKPLDFEHLLIVLNKWIA